jgi:hypothetical protein
MLFTTTTQWIALAVALVAGWLFGLASHPGGRKWKTRYVAERDAHAVTTRRVTELERENGRLVRETPVVERTAATGPIASHAAAPAHPADRRPLI